MAPIPILYFSDILCVWAYIAQLRVDAIQETYGAQIAIEHRFCPVFGDTARKIGAGWADRGGYEGFNAHVRTSVAAFPEVEVNPQIWLAVRPASSMGAHMFLQAVRLGEAAGACPAGAFEHTTRALREAFFRDARDISHTDVQRDVGRAAGVEPRAVESLVADGRAFAALASDYQDAEAMGIAGSPSFVLNDGRQKLYGNVGYRILDANIQELLREPNADHASWC